MNDSRQSNTEIPGPDLARWMKQISSYPPLETELEQSDGEAPFRKLSISVEPEIKRLITKRAKLLGLTRSQYIRLLVDADIANKS